MPAGSSALRLTVIGTGHLGAVQAACLADLGFSVVGLDTDEEKIALLSAGEMPFFEPGLAELLRHNLDNGRLRFTTSYADAADHGDVHFLCVGTPQARDGQGADLGYLDQAVAALAPLLRRQCLVVGRSTVPVGTAAGLASRLAALAPAGRKAVLAWNPDYLREGYAVAGTLRPDRIVIGVSPDRAAAAWAEGRLREIYASMTSAGTPLIVTGYETAELAKVAANAFLATKISFINAMAEVCESARADVTELAATLAHDDRIGGKFLAPGLGFGGGCLPNDIRALRARAADLGAGQATEFLREVDAINDRSRDRVVGLARELAGGSLAGRRVAVLGGAFKPGSDDIRDSPALAVATAISEEDARVTVYDPEATASIGRARPFLETAPSALDAIRGANLVLLLTEWAEFRHLSPHEAGQFAADRVIIDARHALDAGSWQQAGWHYRAPGRPAAPGLPQVPRAATAAAAPPVLTCVRVGVGSSGAIHGKALHRLGVRTLAVLDTNPAHQTAIAAAGLPPCDSYAEAAAYRPGFWDICVPTAAHLDVLEAIIAEDPQANILIEKPLCDFADLPRVSELLARHRGRIVVNENYASSAIPAAIAARVRELGLRVTGCCAEMTKNRSGDFLAGRFIDESAGAFGYEGTHLITIVEEMGYHSLDADPSHAEITDLALADGTALARQGTASVTLRADGCQVRLYTSVEGLIGHAHPPYAPCGRRIPADDTATRYRMLCVQGTGGDGAGYHVAGFFEPLPGLPRSQGVVAAYRDGVQLGEPEYVEDDTVTQHLARAIAHFGGDPVNPCSVSRALRHVHYLHRWAAPQHPAWAAPDLSAAPA
ncbi:MAG: nucleotide sugar dehydrogenase [Nocardiopsaceae bacterium]|nr:nucleotide sugar dehydrogenase [Nocardiopsaceae bacterium]